MKKEEYIQLCQEVWNHNKLYYAGKPIISDEEFDALLRHLHEIEKQHPSWITPESPSQRVGEALTSGFKTVKHTIPMLSLANTYSKEELEQFLTRMHKLTDKPKLAFSCELKMDGVAVSIRYENGVYVRGVTRGNGQSGDDVTNNIKTISTLPMRLKGKNIPDILEVRGEVFMTHQSFTVLNQQRALAEEPLWANPRNAASGSLKLIDPKEAMKRNLSIVIYGVAEDSSHQFETQFQIHDYLEAHGLPTLQFRERCHTINDIWSFAEKIRKERPHLHYDIDGIVIKLDNLTDQEHLSSTGKHPRWAVAYKFAPEQAVTKVQEITVQVGRTGILTPVAELEPVLLAGSTISRATLHNAEEVQRKDIRVGDTVTIEKGGDVIPKVVSVHLNLRPKHSVAFSMPDRCPNCGTAVVHSAGEVAIRCPNKQCTEQRLRRLMHFAGKGSMDIDGLGIRIIEQLMQLGLVTVPSDIYKLTETDLYQVEGFKEKSVHNLRNAIEISKKVSLARFIMALGISHVGAGIAELLAEQSGSINILSEMTEEQLTTIEGIGPKVAQSVREYFDDQQNREEIAKLLESGIAPEAPSKKAILKHAFNGKVFVLTGTLKGYSRTEAANLIKERGGKVTDSVSKKTDFLLVGEEPGSKLDKATSLGVTILSETDFDDLLKK